MNVVIKFIIGRAFENFTYKKVAKVHLTKKCLVLRLSNGAVIKEPLKWIKSFTVEL